MKIEDAIKNLKYLISGDCCDTQMDYIDEIGMAIDSLEKQIPKPPVNRVHEQYPTLGKNHYCICGVMFMDWENQPTNYCGNCGQRLRVYGKIDYKSFIVLRGENMKCKDCYYARGTKNCKVMKYRFENCWAYADKEEGEKREKAIRKYASKPLKG